MEIHKSKLFEDLFSEAYRHRGLIKELSDYQIEKIISITDRKIMTEVNSIVDMINQPEGVYNYPEEVDETKLFEYWAKRKGNLVYKLQDFNDKLIRELHGRHSQTPKLSDEIKERINAFADGGREKYREACIALLTDFEKKIEIFASEKKIAPILRALKNNNTLEGFDVIPTDKTMKGWIDDYRTRFYP